MKNKELIYKCLAHTDCSNCKVKKTCDKFMKKYHNLIPAAVGIKPVGKILETPDGEVIRFNEEFLEREVGT